MPGTVAKVFVSDGQDINEGDSLISVESMKMEYLIRATHNARIKEVRVAESQFVQIGERLIIFEKEEELALWKWATESIQRNLKLFKPLRIY